MSQSDFQAVIRLSRRQNVKGLCVQNISRLWNIIHLLYAQ